MKGASISFDGADELAAAAFETAGVWDVRQPAGEESPEPIAWLSEQPGEMSADELAPTPLQRPLFAACPECGAARAEHANFCAECGAAFSGAERAYGRQELRTTLLGRVGATAIGVCAGLGAALLGYSVLHRSAPAATPHAAARSAAPPRRLAAASVRRAPDAPILRTSLPSAPPAAAPIVVASAAPHEPARRIAVRTVQPAKPRVIRASAHRTTTRIYSPVWVRRPNGEDMARLYPDGARRAARQGEATLDCVFSGAGALTDCAVVSEQPVGLGFGRAALKLAPLFRADPVNTAGWPVAGYRVRVPVEWQPRQVATAEPASD